MKKTVYLRRIIVCLIVTTVVAAQHIHGSIIETKLSPEAQVKQKIEKLQTALHKTIKKRVEIEKEIREIQKNLGTLNSEVRKRNNTLDRIIMTQNVEETKKLEKVKKLIENGAYINSKNPPFGRPPLNAAASQGHPKIVKFLIDSGAEVNAISQYGNNALFSAKTPEVVKILADAGIKLNMTERNYGRTALLSAIGGNMLEKALALVEAGADVNLASNDTTTPLIEASRRGSLELVVALLQNDADPNKANNRGETPLISAIKTGNLKIVLALLKKKADPNIADNYGKTALDYARKLERRTRKKMLDLLTGTNPLLSPNPIR